MATATKERPKQAAAKKGAKLDQLSAMAASSKAYEDEIRAQAGSSNSFITLVQGNTGILKPDNKAYIKTAKLYDYVISKSKLRLGATLDVTILGMFKLYVEKEKAQKQSDMAKTVSFWMPEDAEQIPLAPGSNFERQLPNGHWLQVTHWIFVYLHNHPEIEDALIAVQSLGNRVHAELQKEVAAQSELCSELRFTVGKQVMRGTSNDTENYYPKFEVSGRNFKYEGDKVVLLKGGLPEDELAEVLRRSQALHEEYANKRMVAQKNLAAIVGVAPRPALPAAGYDEEDDEAAVTF
jgi:hypothetical protein